MTIHTSLSRRWVHSYTPLFLCLLLALLLCGCAKRTSTDEIRSALSLGDVERLETNLTKTHETYGELVTALNLARVYQIGGRWRESIKAFDDAVMLLEEYESRAEINVRQMLSGLGTIFFSRGAESYFGAGYERSLIHTFNSLNYMMLGDFTGAAVEIRRMDKRQELWLLESSARIEKYIEEHNSLDSPDSLPQGYSMRELLQDDAVRRLINNYQDPFSYSLGAILLRLAGDRQAADVSMRRAIALDPSAGELFGHAWASSSARDSFPRVPQLPAATEGKPRPGQKSSDSQEVTVIAFSGLAPALHVENVRVWFPAIGYILIDLPSYTHSVKGVRPQALLANDQAVTLYPLLQTELLAYRTLWDEVRLEYTLAATRAVTRAGASAAAYAAASSHKDTQAYAPLISTMTTVLMDLFATSMSGSVRNWETLPNVGYLGVTSVPRGTTLTLRSGGSTHRIDLPPDARGVIILANELSNNSVKVKHVTY